MSEEKKHNPYPLEAMVDNLGKPPKEVLDKGKALLARLENHEKKASGGGVEANREAQGRTDHTQMFTPPHEMSFDEASKALDEMLPQAAARRTAQSLELTSMVGPLRGSIPVVARTPTLAAQLGKLRLSSVSGDNLQKEVTPDERRRTERSARQGSSAHPDPPQGARASQAVGCFGQEA